MRCIEPLQLRAKRANDWGESIERSVKSTYRPGSWKAMMICSNLTSITLYLKYIGITSYSGMLICFQQKSATSSRLPYTVRLFKGTLAKLSLESLSKNNYCEYKKFLIALNCVVLTRLTRPRTRRGRCVLRKMITTALFPLISQLSSTLRWTAVVAQAQWKWPESSM